ncbi:MAG TPA: DUF4870 domain-containing protein [Chthoniobacterales bacterium]|jgi:uncharacterized membrane protein
MPDPVDPIDPVPPPVTPVAETTPGHPTSTGLPSNVAAALACFPLIGGIIFYLLEKRDSFVRFYAMQSIIFGAIWILFNIVSGIIREIFWSIPGFIGHIFGTLWALASALVQIGFLVVLIIAIVKAFSGVRWDIPWVGPIARRQTHDTI